MVNKQNISEGFLQCSLDDVEKKAKMVIFGVYNWDPTKVTFFQQDGSVHITMKSEFPETLLQSEDVVLFHYLKGIDKRFNDGMTKEFENFCTKSRLKFLSKATSIIDVGVFVSTIINHSGQIIRYGSDESKRVLTKQKIQPSNEITIQIGLFTRNLR